MLRLAWRLANAAGRWSIALPREAARALNGAAPDTGTGPRPLSIAMLIVLPVALLVAMLFAEIQIVVSPSISAWIVYRAPGPIRHGDLVSFALVHPLAGPTPVNVTKRALCLPGDVLKSIERPSAHRRGMSDGYYYCGRRLLGVSQAFDSRGRALDHFHWGTRTIPAGFLFAASDHPMGLDSRYFGLVALSRVTRMEQLL